MSGADVWRVGIVGAMEVEVEDLIHGLAHAAAVELGPAEAWTGELAGVPVAVVQSGVGKAAAAAVTQALVSAVPVYALVNTGVAGALDPSCRAFPAASRPTAPSWTSSRGCACPTGAGS